MGKGERAGPVRGLPALRWKKAKDGAPGHCGWFMGGHPSSHLFCWSALGHPPGEADSQVGAGGFGESFQGAS